MRKMERSWITASASRRGGAVRSLGRHLDRRVDPVRVVRVDLILQRGGDQDIRLLFEPGFPGSTSYPRARILVLSMPPKPVGDRRQFLEVDPLFFGTRTKSCRPGPSRRRRSPCRPAGGGAADGVLRHVAESLHAGGGLEGARDPISFKASRKT